MIEIYGDGAFNPGRQQGGWGAVLVENAAKKAISGSVKEKATNNRMEITAALEGILSTPAGSQIVVYTDSQYLFGCMTQGWQKRANRDLWEKMDSAVSQRNVRWVWQSDTADSPLHEAHNLANTRASQGELSLEANQKPARDLTHIDKEGRPRMVDISAKPDTAREAIARGRVIMKAATLEMIKNQTGAKGDALVTAQLAGIMGAKQTPHLIPLCHPLLLADINVELALNEKDSVVDITATVKSTGQTGVEMEALTAVAVSALTIYDVCKAVDRAIRITDIRLVRKSGGKSGLIELE